MPVTLAFAIALAATKVGGLLIGSLVHEGKKIMKHFGVDHEDTARASCLLIKDQQLSLQETPIESPSGALILCASRELVPSTSSRDLAILTCDSLDIGSHLFPVTNIFNLLAAWSWFRARFIALVKSALRSVISDMKVAIASFFGSVTESAVQKKEFASISFFIQLNFSRLVAKVAIILKEAVRLLKSRTEKKMSTYLRQIFPAGIGRVPVSNTSVGNYVSVDTGAYTQKYLAMVTTFVKRALAIFFGASTSLLGPLLRLQGSTVTRTRLVLLLCVGISLVGWSIPLMIFKGSKTKQSFLQQPVITEPAADLETGSFTSITSRLIGTSNSFCTSSMDMGAITQQVDMNHIHLADCTYNLHSWPSNDFRSASTPEFQTGYFWNEDKAAVSLFNWNIDAYHYIQSRCVSGSALESSLFINVFEMMPCEDHASNGIATEYSGGSSVPATIDEARVTRYISQAPQNEYSGELELCPTSSVADGDASTKLIMTIAVDPLQLQALSKINYLSRELDGYSDSMKVDDRYSDSSTAVQLHEELLIAYSRGLILYAWLENDVINASLSGWLTGYFWNREASVSVNYCIQQSASSLFAFAPEDLSSDSYATGEFSLDSLGLGLGHFLPSNRTGGDTSCMQMRVAELGPSKELSAFQCRELDGISSQDAMMYPQLRLADPSDQTNRRFFVAEQSSLRIGTLKESSSLHIFGELHQLALMLLMLAYHNSDRTADDEPDVALSSGSEISSGTNLDLDLEEVSDNEAISANKDNGEDIVLLCSTNIVSSRRELMALRSELGAHWKSPSTSKRRMRRSPRTRSRPKYFEPTWAAV